MRARLSIGTSFSKLALWVMAFSMLFNAHMLADNFVKMLWSESVITPMYGIQCVTSTVAIFAMFVLRRKVLKQMYIGQDLNADLEIIHQIEEIQMYLMEKRL